MKMYDVAFFVGSVVTLFVISWDKAAAEALISGATIGAYVMWRAIGK